MCRTKGPGLPGSVQSRDGTAAILLHIGEWLRLDPVGEESGKQVRAYYCIPGPLPDMPPCASRPSPLCIALPAAGGSQGQSAAEFSHQILDTNPLLCCFRIGLDGGGAWGWRGSVLV